MSKDASKLACEQFQQELSEIGSDADFDDLEDHPHAKACDTCRQLLQQLKIITEAARTRFGIDY